jgi:23S rRNA (uracil1939-C5)-methyltransferase
MSRVLELAPQRIAYVSCNPSTLARDLKKLAERYDIESIRMIDLFPNTFHIEALAFLTRRET